MKARTTFPGNLTVYMTFDTKPHGLAEVCVN